MAKVEGSNPFIRFDRNLCNYLHSEALQVGSAGGEWFG
jgi:hypothetical protein